MRTGSWGLGTCGQHPSPISFREGKLTTHTEELHPQNPYLQDLLSAEVRASALSCRPSAATKPHWGRERASESPLMPEGDLGRGTLSS